MLGAGVAQAVELHGAGSTFIAPLMDGWINYFDQSQPDIVIRYDAIGSGQGVARFASGAIDFGATDNYVPAADAPAGERGTVELPSAAGMIVLAYNLPGLKGRLNLPRDVYVDIFRGKIRTWDDPRIVAANPGLKLPPISIATVVRQDASGTTYAFTDHLAAISAEWAEKPGVGKTIDWPHVAMLARGNEGVASKIRISQGAIGYIEYSFALRLGLAMAALQNKAGKFVAPTPLAGAAALEPSASVDLDKLDRSTLDPAGPKPIRSSPIAGSCSIAAIPRSRRPRRPPFWISPWTRVRAMRRSSATCRCRRRSLSAQRPWSGR